MTFTCMAGLVAVAAKDFEQLRAKLRHAVPSLGLNSKKLDPRGLECSVQKDVAASAVRRLVRAVIKLDCKGNPGGLRLAEDKVEMLLRNCPPETVLPIFIRAGKDVGDTDLTHDEVAASNCRKKRSVEGGFPPREQCGSAAVGEVFSSLSPSPRSAETIPPRPSPRRSVHDSDLSRAAVLLK